MILLMPCSAFSLGTPAEHWLHRLYLHWRGAHCQRGKRFHFLLHGVHHRWLLLDRYSPLDHARCHRRSIPLYFGFLGLFLLGFERFGWALHAGLLVAGYLFYDLTHFLAASRCTAQLATGRRLKRNHMLHHSAIRLRASRCRISSGIESLAPEERNGFFGWAARQGHCHSPPDPELPRPPTGRSLSCFAMLEWMEISSTPDTVARAPIHNAK